MEDVMSQRTEVTLDGKTFIAYYTTKDRNTGEVCPECGWPLEASCVEELTEVLDAGKMVDETSPEILEKIRQVINKEAAFFFTQCSNINGCDYVAPEEEDDE